MSRAKPRPSLLVVCALLSCGVLACSLEPTLDSAPALQSGLVGGADVGPATDGAGALDGDAAAPADAADLSDAADAGDAAADAGDAGDAGDAALPDTADPGDAAADAGPQDDTLGLEVFEDIALPDAGDAADPADAGDAGDAADAPDAGDGGPIEDLGPLPDSETPGELCGDFVDNNDDGRIDEGCHPPPVLQPFQSWDDRGLVYGNAIEPPPWVPFALGSPAGRAMVIHRPIDGTPTDWLVTLGLAAPGGDAWIDPKDLAGSKGRVLPLAGVAPVLLGIGDALVPKPGDWFVNVQRYTDPDGGLQPTAGWVHVGVVTAPPQGTAQLVLDLEVVMVDSVKGDAASYGASADWQETRLEVEKAWKPAGLALGEVAFRDLLGPEASLYKHVDFIDGGADVNEIDALIKLAAVGSQHPERLQVLLVASLNDSAGVPSALGVSGAIGSMGGLGTARASSILLADQSDPKKLGKTFAHELGHHLGLYHTDEFDGETKDLISDTEPCKAAIPKASSCAAQATNLMFWSPTGLAISNGQAKVVRRNPGLRD